MPANTRVNRPTAQPGVTPRDWRHDVVGVSGIVVLLGAWLIVSPFVLDYRAGDASWHTILCGVLVAALAAWQTIRRVATPAPGLALIAIGVWMLISGFWLPDSSQASWNAWGPGALLVFLGSVSVAATGRRAA